MKNAFNDIKSISNFLGLCPNFDKWEIVRIGVLKNVNVTLTGMKIVNPTQEIIKVLGVHISHNKKIQDDLNFCKIIKNLCNVIKPWRVRKLWKAKYTAQKIKFSIKDFFSKCDQIHSFLRIWSHLLKKSLMENFIFCAVITIFQSLAVSTIVQLAIITKVPNNVIE